MNGMHIDIALHSDEGGRAVDEFRIAAGHVMVMDKHENPHLAYLVAGVVALDVRGDTRILQAPQIVVIEEGTHHGIKALTDTIWLDIHACGESRDRALPMPDMAAAREVQDRLSRYSFDAASVQPGTRTTQ